MSSVAGEIWGGGYSFTPFEVLTTGLKFRYSKRAVAERTEKMAASNLAVAWHERSLEEGLVGGVLQGRRQFDVRGGSKTSRRRMWELAVEVARMDGVEEVKTLLEVESYSDIRNGDGLADRRRVKDFVRGTALKGWVRNVGDDDFGL
jgi:tRNA-specific adenosine deaminase 1